jgi:hypothetical protein
MFAIFHQEMCRGNALHVRGTADNAVRAIAANADTIATEAVASSLWIKKSVPQGLKLAALKKAGFEVD